MNRFQRLSVATVVATVALIAVGGLVRASGSGLGCPDWPRCFGRWVPPLEASALIEYSHRLLAAVVGLLVLALAVAAWTRHRSSRPIFLPSLAALLVVVFQGGLGRVVVEGELESQLVAFHFGVSLTLLALVVVVAVNALVPRPGRLDSTVGGALVVSSWAAITLMLGAFVTQMGAALAFGDWPLFDGGILPGGDPAKIVHYLHRIAALVLGGVLVGLAIGVARRRPRDRAMTALAHGAAAVWLAQVAIGAANVLLLSAPWAVAVHVALGAVLWAAVVALGALAYRRAGARSVQVPTDLEAAAGRSVTVETADQPGRAGIMQTFRSYLALTKPRIIELLLITTVPAMVLAEGGWPSTWLVLATLAGGTLTAGAANAINCYLDRDIDARMERTAVRPLPRGEVAPSSALRFGIVLGAVGFAWLWAATNLLAAALALGAILFYVFVYTIWLKRSTPTNIVIGGAAGAVPVLVGWAAVTGTIGVEALVLFAIVFYWTPPHFWALALRYSSDYQAAGVPMLPVVRGTSATTKQILLYSVALVAMSLVLYSLSGLGILYLGCALFLGAIFLREVRSLHRKPSDRKAMTVFRASIAYLTALFVAIGVDVIGGIGRWENVAAPLFALAAVGFFAAKAAVLAALVRAGSPATGPRTAEVVWTLIPTVLAAGLFAASLRPL